MIKTKYLTRGTKADFVRTKLKYNDLIYRNW